jgi:phage FluMu protein Com
MVELGDFLGVDLSIGRETVKLEFDGYKLFVLRDMRTLVALPILNGRLRADKVYMWSSAHTFVCARGIVDGLTPVRCADCDGLLCTASSGSVISVICGRCKTHNIIEVKKPIDNAAKSPQNR